MFEFSVCRCGWERLASEVDVSAENNSCPDRRETLRRPSKSRKTTEVPATMAWFAVQPVCVRSSRESSQSWNSRFRSGSALRLKGTDQTASKWGGPTEAMDSRRESPRSIGHSTARYCCGVVGERNRGSFKTNSGKRFATSRETSFRSCESPAAVAAARILRK